MRLIDADALEISTEFSDDGEYSWDIVPAFRIREAPTIDVVPVVRCKDCKFFEYGDYCCEDKMEHSYAREDDYCSYGERKDGDDNG